MRKRSDSALRRLLPGGFLILFATIILCCNGARPESGEPRAVNDSVQFASAMPDRAFARPGWTSTYEERQGAVLFGRYCAVCHGPEGKGDGFNAFNLDPRPRDLSDSTYMRALSDAQVLQTISGGGRSVNKSPLMPPYGWTLSRQEVLELGAFVRTLGK